MSRNDDKPIDKSDWNKKSLAGPVKTFPDKAATAMKSTVMVDYAFRAILLNELATRT